MTERIRQVILPLLKLVTIDYLILNQLIRNMEQNNFDDCIDLNHYISFLESTPKQVVYETV